MTQIAVSVAPFYSAHVEDSNNFVKGFMPGKERDLRFFLNTPKAMSNPDDNAFICNNSSPEISVIMPVYNAERFLHFALDSLKKQTFLNFEAICVNDGSTDCSLEILKEYAKDDCRIRVINNLRNLHAGVSRNIAMKEARGKYITFLDADDAFTTDALEQFYVKGIETDADCIVCQLFNSRGNLEYGLRPQYLPPVDCFSAADIPDFVFNFTHGGPNGKCVKRSLIIDNKIEYSTLNRSEDIIFVYKTLIKSKKISVINKPLYQKDFIFNENSLEHTKNETPLIFWDAITEINSMLREEGVFEKFKRSIINANIKRCLYNVNMLKRSSGYNILKVKKLFCDSGVDKIIIKELELYNREAEYFFVPEYPELLSFLEKTYEEYANDVADYAAGQEEQLQKMKSELKELITSQKQYAKYSTLRVDIRNNGDENNNVIEHSVSPEPFSLKRPGWLKNGITIESEAKSMTTVLQCQGDGELEISLMGQDVRNEKGVRYPVWIDCTYFAVNGEMIFNDTKTVCHDKRYIYRKTVKDGEEIMLKMTWSESQSSKVLDENRQLQVDLKNTKSKVHETKVALEKANAKVNATEVALKKAIDKVSVTEVALKKATDKVIATEDALKNAKDENVKSKQEKQKVANDLEKVKQEKQKVANDLEKVKQENAKLERELKNVKNGWSFKIGRVITWLPRRIKK